MGIVIGAVAVVFVLALIIFPGVRGKLKVLVGGFLNIFVEDIAKTPEGAKAVFQQAIEEVQERYNKAGDTLNRFVGEQSSVQKNLNKLYGELKDVESKCESLVRSGNMADAAIFSTRREEILFEISQKEGYLREIEPTVAVTALFHDLTKVNYYTVSSRNVKDDVTGAWHKEPFYKTEDRLPLGHGEKSVIILQSFIKLTRDEIVAIRWHMGSFDCAVKGGDYGMGNAFETYPLAVMTHLADMEATYLVEGLATK